MSEFPTGPSDVSNQMGSSLAQRLSAAGIFVAITGTRGETRADLLRSTYSPPAPISMEPTGISTAGDEWDHNGGPGPDDDLCEFVSPDELGIEDMEITRNIWSEVGAFSVIATSSTDRAVWVPSKPPDIAWDAEPRPFNANNGWDGEWRDYA